MDRGRFLLANRRSVVFQECRAPRKGHLLGLGRGIWEGDSSMLHVTCDLCGKELRAGEDHRYVVKIEAFAVHDPAEITEADLDEDHMEALSQALRALEDDETSADIVEPYKNFRYDLCSDCHRKFVQNPLAKDAAGKFDFSEN
jgi:hypothetical protein